MTREMNKPEWQMTKHYCLLCKPNTKSWCLNCIFNKTLPQNRKLDDWIQPFVDELNERLKK